MTIRYQNGAHVEAILLSQTDTMMRVAAESFSDTLELTRVDGAWITDDCEPVEVEFGFAHRSAAAPPAEEDCICSHEMAATLIHLLFAGENGPQEMPVAQKAPAPIYCDVI